MESSLLIAVSRQSTLRRQLSVIANNLANADTAGFKAERMMVEAYPMRVRGEKALPVKIDFVEDAATMRVTTDGGLRETGSRLDVALRGDGYLVVETAEGPRYTRLGRMTVDVDGMLKTEAGHPVLSKSDQPIVVGADDAGIEIARDGTISNATGVLGQLKVVQFSAGGAMRAVSGGMMTTEETPKTVAQPDIVQGSLEDSNVEPIQEITRMIDVQRAYARTRKMIEQEDERLKKMIDDFTRAA